MLDLNEIAISWEINEEVEDYNPPCRDDWYTPCAAGCIWWGFDTIIVLLPKSEFLQEDLALLKKDMPITFKYKFHHEGKVFEDVECFAKIINTEFVDFKKDEVEVIIKVEGNASTTVDTQQSNHGRKI